MTKARILADYVAGGTTAAEFDYMDGVTSNVQTQMDAKAPLASPAFTGTPTGITAAHLEAGVLPSDVTGGSGLTALGTVVSGNISHADIVYPAGHVINIVQYAPTTTVTDTHGGSTDTWETFTLTSGQLTGASKVLLTFSHYFNNSTTATHGYSELKFWKTSVTSGGGILGQQYFGGYEGNDPEVFRMFASAQYFDTSPDLSGQSYIWTVYANWSSSVEVGHLHATAFIIK